MSDGTVHSRTGPATRTLLIGWAQVWRSYAGFAVPLALVLVFIKFSYQPAFSIRGARADLGDLAIGLAVLCALLTLRSEGFDCLRRSSRLWAAYVVFLAFVFADTIYPRFRDVHYAEATHLVTAFKFTEYAILAPATAVLVRSRRALACLVGTVAALACAAGFVGALQFFGVHIFAAWPAGWRQPSFAGISELGTLGVAALAVGFLGMLWPGTISRRTALAALAGGAVVLVVSGAIEGGIALAAVGLSVVLLVWRRRRLHLRGFIAVASVSVVCAAGLLALRGGDIAQYGRDIGVLAHAPTATSTVNTFAQRSLMYYIALRVFEAHPLLGSGWQSIRETQVYSPFLAAAHREFPNQPAQAFPSPAHTWSVDDAYLQSLAEMGLVGTALLLLLLATGLWTGLSDSLRDPTDEAWRALLGLLWLLTSCCIWLGQGLIAGVFFEAFPFIGLGVVAAARAVLAGSPSPQERRWSQ